MKKLAVALGGLGGFNNHGAGVLQALRDYKQTPQLITATSGQIVVLYEYLRGTDLSTLFTENALDSLKIATHGVPGVFRPAHIENIFKWVSINPIQDNIIDIMFPAQKLVPTRTNEHIEDMVRIFNSSDIGVIFNSFELKTGKGITYGNNKARELLSDFDIQDIDTNAIMSSLWLTLYGFDDAPDGRVDGAYHRSLLLREMYGFERIVTAKPAPTGWNTALPKNQYEMKDWETKLNFSNTYDLELDELRRLDKILGTNTVIIEIINDLEFGYMDYFQEKTVVFKNSYEKMEKILNSEKSS